MVDLQAMKSVQLTKFSAFAATVFSNQVANGLCIGLSPVALPWVVLSAAARHAMGMDN